MAHHDFTDDSLNVPVYTATDWEKAVAICEAFGAKVVLPAFEDSVLEGVTVTVQGVFNTDGNWEPMVSIPISEYEELVEIKAMYEKLCK